MLLVSYCSCLYPIRWSQVLSWEWRCSWSSADRRCSNYVLVINNLIAYQSASYIRDLTVIHCTKTSINQLCISVDSCVINGIRYLCSQIYHHLLLGRWVQVNWSQFGQDAQHPPQPIVPVCIKVVHVAKVHPQVVRPIVLKGRNIKCLYLFVEQRNIISASYNFILFFLNQSDNFS